MEINKNQKAFIELVRAGLWEKEVRLSPSDVIDYSAVYQLAQKQSVVGLVAVGIEYVKDVFIPQNTKLTFVGYALQIEQRNVGMNAFVAALVEELRQKDVSVLLLKGQGIAQCYERPLWRTCGDVDFYLSEVNYNSAKELILPLASEVETEGVYSKHLGMIIDGWTVELHGTLRCGLSRKIDRVLDSIYEEAFNDSKVRSWKNGKIHVFLPSVDNDVVYIFTHILDHFFKGGIGLRQICDWCRLLWTYRDLINRDLLENRLRSMSLMTEWKAFGFFAVENLGMPIEVMPFYSSKVKWSRKARRIQDFIMEVGNFGHNRDISYYDSKPYIKRKTISFGRKCGDFCKQVIIFPLDSFCFYSKMMYNSLRSVARGK